MYTIMLAIFLNMLLLYSVAAIDIGEASDVGEGVGVLDERTGDDAATGTGGTAEDAGESSGEARERGKEETEVWVKQGRS